MLIVLLLLIAAPASACGVTIDGGLHHHLELACYLAGTVGMVYGLCKCRVKNWFKK